MKVSLAVSLVEEFQMLSLFSPESVELVSLWLLMLSPENSETVESLVLSGLPVPPVLV